MSDIYVLAIADTRHDWVNNPANILKRVREMATQRGHIVIPVSSLAQFREIVETHPRNAVIINAHGEALPLPHEEDGNWISFIRKIGMNVRNHGWIWTSITGYPFHYYGPESNRIPQPWMAGLATFLSVAEQEIEIVPIPGELMRLTADGNRALEKIGVQILSQLRVGRGFFWRNVALTSFLTSGTAHGACSVQIGEGFFVCCGIGANDLGHPNADQESDRRLADTSLAFTLAIVESDLEREFGGCEDDENRFRENVVVPLLRRKGFSGVSTLHPREFGKDVVFYEIDNFDEKKYFAIQISARKIHKNVRGDQAGYAGTIARQAEEAFVNPYRDPDTGEEQYIHEVYVFTSKAITQDAKEHIRQHIGNRRGLVHFFDRNRVLELIRAVQ